MKQQKQMVDVGQTVRIDFHSHILPHLDHGSDSRDTSASQLAMMQAAGTQVVCATSHFYPQRISLKPFLKKREECLTALLRRVDDAPRPQILLGAVVLICEGLENMDGLRELCLQGTNLLLLEMPFLGKSVWTPKLYETAEEIMAMGIQPVLAHVDRYPKKAVEPLLKKGLLAQVNADGLCRLMKRKQLVEWINSGYVVALGSDLHEAAADGYRPWYRVMTSMPEQFRTVMERTEKLVEAAVRY